MLCAGSATQLSNDSPRAIKVKASASAFTLEPGDVVATGTPGGVGISMKPPRLLVAGDVVLDRRRRTVAVAGEDVELTAREFDLLWHLAERPGIVVGRERLLDRVWGLEFPGGTRTVDVHVGQLRRKLERPQLIRTVRGSGYKLVP